MRPSLRLVLGVVLGSLLALSTNLPAQEPAQPSTARAGRGTAIRSAITAAMTRLQVHGQLRQETAYRVDDSGEFTKLKQQALLTEQIRLNEHLSASATQRLYYDAVFDLTDNFPSSVESDQEFEAEARETYLDYSQGPFDVRLGKQQIVWGDAVGLFFADVVNAKDLREYILPDFDLIRIPQWGLDAEWSGDVAHAEFVWLPVLAFDKLGVTGSEFEFPRPVPLGVASTLTDPATPPSSFNNSEVGTRLSYLLNGWDVSLFYFYTWDKLPVLFRTIQSGVYNFAPAYRRAHLLGGSFSKALSDVVLKGEWVLNPQQHFSTLDATDADGVVQRSVIDYLVGLDYTFFDRLETNVQLMQRVIPNHPDLLANEDTTRTHLSVWLKTAWFDGKVEPELLFISRLSEQDLLYRPKVTVDVTDSLQWRMGADIFQGNSSGLFGRFDKHSRIYTELRFQF